MRSRVRSGMLTERDESMGSRHGTTATSSSHQNGVRTWGDMARGTAAKY